MNKRLMTVLGFAVVVSALATFLVYRFLATKLNANAAAPATKVVVAAQNIALGSLIRDMDLRVVDWPGAVPKGAVNDTRELVGRGVIQPIYEGEPILDSRLAAKGAGGGLAATIPPGMRAVAVRVNEVVGVSGFVLPGMRVDVLIAGNPPGNNNQNTGTLTKTILQNIEVLSAGASIQRDAEGKPLSVPVVNLLVTPEQAEVLSLASNEMKTQLVLRNPLDKEVANTPGAAVAQLFGAKVPLVPASNTGTPAPARRVVHPKPVVPLTPAPVAEKEKPVVPLTVEVIHGVRRSEAKFTPTEEAKP